MEIILKEGCGERDAGGMMKGQMEGWMKGWIRDDGAVDGGMKEG